jgi:hypothetical protein
MGPSQGGERVATAYCDAMRNPWTTLVESLSGAERKAPMVWPARRVHRVMDDPPASEPKQLTNQAPIENVRRPILAHSTKEPGRLRCSCAVCKLGLKQPQSAI